MVKDVPADVLIQRMQEFGKLWQKYMDLFNKAQTFEDPETIGFSDEKEFRKLQVDIIRRATFLTLAVPNNIFDLAKDVKKLFMSTPSMYILKKEVNIQISSYRALWHDVSIALNQKQGQLRAYLAEHETGSRAKRK